jgi:tetratricopeptide (TPR) repeat protein
MLRSVLASLLIGCLVFGGATAFAGPSEEAAQAFADGKALLAKADFEGALKAFEKAAKTDVNNPDYKEHYAILRQIVKLRERSAEETDEQRWVEMAQALRAFYHEHGIHGEALPLDREIYRRQPGSHTVAQLAETQLALGMNSETVELLSDLPKEQRTERTKVLLGLAYARQGRTEEAASIADQVSVKACAGPDTFFELACLHARVGENDGALTALTRSFELTPPSSLENRKADAKSCEDLAALAQTPEFAAALKTESKVKESGCSGGASCGKCPKRGGCSKKNK